MEMTAAYAALFLSNGHTHKNDHGDTITAHTLAELPLLDIGPGLSRKTFRLRECFVCSSVYASRLGMRILDLDAEQHVRQETKPGVFELKGTRKP